MGLEIQVPFPEGQRKACLEQEPAAEEDAEAGDLAEGISAIGPPAAMRGLRTEISPGLAGAMGWASPGKINQRKLKAPLRGVVPVSLKTYGPGWGFME